MIKFIRNLFFNQRLISSEPKSTHSLNFLAKELHQNEKDNCLSFYYLNLYLDSLPTWCMYSIHEQCNDAILTHKLTKDCVVFSYKQMVDYVRFIYLPSHPPKLILKRY